MPLAWALGAPVADGAYEPSESAGPMDDAYTGFTGDGAFEFSGAGGRRADDVWVGFADQGAFEFGGTDDLTADDAYAGLTGADEPLLGEEQFASEPPPVDWRPSALLAAESVEM
jgi:hypothetical protein